MNDSLNHFVERIDKLTTLHQPKFGKMNAHQMVCHCSDFYRLIFREIQLNEKPLLSLQEVTLLAQSKKTVPSPKEIDQVAGNGTSPNNFELDLAALKKNLEKFYGLDDGYDYPSHFYFGKLSPQEWRKIAYYHMNHHLKQFKV